MTTPSKSWSRWAVYVAALALVSLGLIGFWLKVYAQPQPGIAVAISPSSYSVGEADGSVTLTVSLSQSSSGTVTVDFATGGGTATGNSDYVSGSGTLVFAPGETSHTIIVTIINDPCSEANETFTVTLSNASGGTISSSTSTVTILDED